MQGSTEVPVPSPHPSEVGGVATDQAAPPMSDPSGAKEADETDGVQPGGEKETPEVVSSVDPSGTPTVADENAKALEEERQRWTANSSISFSRLVDPIESSEFLSYATGMSRQAADHSTWGFSVAFGQDGKLRDDPIFSNLSWSRGFAFDKEDPRAIAMAYSGGLLDPQKIGTQGGRLHNAFSARQHLFRQGSFAVVARASTFLLFTEYEQTVSGQEYTHFGLGEALIVSYGFGKFSFSASFSFDQGYRADAFHFSNSNSQSIDYSFDAHWSAGGAHGISTLVLDPVARSTQPTVLLGDAENSQVSLYLNYSR